MIKFTGIGTLNIHASSEGIVRCIKRILPDLFYLHLRNISFLAAATHTFVENIIRIDGSGGSLEMIRPLTEKAGILITGGGK